MGPFARRLPITVPVDPASATARYHNGFLYVTFARADGGRRAARVEVDA